MMDFVLEAWVSGIIEGKKIQWMMGKRVCGLQRDAQHGIGCKGGRDAAADPADSGAGEC